MMKELKSRTNDEDISISNSMNLNNLQFIRICESRDSVDRLNKKWAINGEPFITQLGKCYRFYCVFSRTAHLSHAETDDLFAK